MSLQEKREQANKLLADMRALNDAAIEQKRALNDEELAKFNAMERDFDELKAQINAIETQNQINLKILLMNIKMAIILNN